MCCGGDSFILTGVYFMLVLYWLDSFKLAINTLMNSVCCCSNKTMYETREKIFENGK